MQKDSSLTKLIGSTTSLRCLAVFDFTLLPCCLWSLIKIRVSIVLFRKGYCKWSFPSEVSTVVGSFEIFLFWALRLLLRNIDCLWCGAWPFARARGQLASRGCLKHPGIRIYCKCFQFLECISSYISSVASRSTFASKLHFTSIQYSS